MDPIVYPTVELTAGECSAMTEFEIGVVYLISDTMVRGEDGELHAPV